MLGFFDLETQLLFDDVDPLWNQLSFSEKERRRHTVTSRLRLAVGGILTSSGRETLYEEEEAANLLDALARLDTVVGYNVFSFDYPVLEPYDSKNRIPSIGAKTLDMFDYLRARTGQYIKLDDLGRLNIGQHKTEDSRTIPSMWRSGSREKVRAYLHNDLLLTRLVFEKGRKDKTLRYPLREYGKEVGRASVSIDW